MDVKFDQQIDLNQITKEVIEQTMINMQRFDF